MAEWIAPRPNTPTAQLLLPDSKGVRRRTAAFASHMPLFGTHFIECRWLTCDIFWKQCMEARNDTLLEEERKAWLAAS
jgi:hypothetical protein